MRTEHVAILTLRYLFTDEGLDPLNFYSSDIVSLVKHTYRKLGYSPSLVPDEELEEVAEIVEEKLENVRKKKRSQRSRQEKASSIVREAWYREAMETAVDSPEGDEDYPDKEHSHNPGENELPPEPFRKYPKKLV